MTLPEGQRIAALEARLDSQEQRWQRVERHMADSRDRGLANIERLTKIEASIEHLLAQVGGPHRGVVGGVGAAIGGAVATVAQWLRSAG